ncbi:MAG: DUF2911 domain-containing protein [Bacteroidetes bacterium]|nr:DUF2911 domain-containing protein [Bacteroidota bacterium]
MKKSFLTILIISMLLGTNVAWSQITLPAPSPAGKVYSKVGLADVEITYSRPKMKERKIFGEGDDYLVPYGKMWRTGANAGTLITFSDDVIISGDTVPAGEYMILTIPGADEWTIIFYKDASIGGNMSSYKEEDAQLKVNVAPVKLTETVQVLTFNVADIHPENTGAAIELAWENTSVKVPFEVNFNDKVMASIEANTKVNPRNYVTAANYYFNTGKDSKQALEWIEKYFAADENYKSQFWNLHLMAQIQKATGDIEGAKATAEESLERASKADGGDFGYIKRNEEFLASLK